MPLSSLARPSAGVAGSWTTRPTRAGARPVGPRPRAPLTRMPSAPAAAAAPSPTPSPPLAPAITVTPTARARLNSMLAEKQAAPGAPPMILRVGVKSGGCNGMSYTMEFVERATLTSDDSIFDLGDGVGAACDPKSLLFLFGLELGFSDELIGGGFSFQNPNADGSCGCGKSFNV
jgi:iron-sulfur cluster assembly accessory protein